MSHSPTESEGSDNIDPRYEQSSLLFNEMIRKGRSLSGHERNCAFLNLGKTGPLGLPQFATISGLSGLDFDDDGRAVAVVDWDGDGDLDLWVRNRSAPQIRMMRNEMGRASGHFLSLKLVGDEEGTNHDAIGAKAEVFLKDRSEGRLVRSVRAGEGFLSQSSQWLHFGLGAGDVPDIDRVEIRWPNTKSVRKTVHTGIEANSRVVIRQSHAAPEVMKPRDQTKINLEELPVELPSGGDSIRVQSVRRLPWPGIRYRDHQGNERIESGKEGHWTLAMVWANWCGACAAEMSAFAQSQQKLLDANVDVLALSVDDLDGGAIPDETSSAVEQAITKSGFPFPYGYIDLEQMATIQMLHDYQVRIHPDIPVPTSFLVSPSRQIIAVYKGLVSVDQIVEDVAATDLTFPERYRWAMVNGGTQIPSKVMRQAELDREFNFYLYAGERLREDSPTTALAFLKEGLVLRPGDPGNGRLLAEVYGQLDRHAEGDAIYKDIASRSAVPAGERANAFYQLGVGALRRKEQRVAVIEFERALDIQPDHLLALNNASYLLANSKAADDEDRRRAVEYAERAVKLTDAKQANFLDTLGTAYRSSEQEEMAEKTYHKALTLAREAGDSRLEAKLQSKLNSLRR